MTAPSLTLPRLAIAGVKMSHCEIPATAKKIASVKDQRAYSREGSALNLSVRVILDDSWLLSVCYELSGSFEIAFADSCCLIVHIIEMML